ncbi:MAG: hypothetical protein R2828_10230 [Saprospiraceae bacterium]
MIRLQTFQQAIQKSIYQGWRWLLKHAKAPLLLSRKAVRHTFRGRLGLNTAYVIHASPSPSPSVEMDHNIRALVQQTEQRFQEGHFFECIGQQVDLGPAVITSRLKQGLGDEQVDHIIAIYPQID